MRFIYKGEVIRGTDSPAYLRMNSKDSVYVVLADLKRSGVSNDTDILESSDSEKERSKKSPLEFEQKNTFAGVSPIEMDPPDKRKYSVEKKSNIPYPGKKD